MQVKMSFDVVTASLVETGLAARLVLVSRVRIALRSAYFRRAAIGCAKQGGESILAMHNELMAPTRTRE